MARFRVGRKLLPTAASVYLAGLVGVYLLYPGFGGYETLTAQKAVLFYLLSALPLGAAVLRLELALVGTMPWPDWKHLGRRLGPVQLLILAYWLWSALSTVCSVNPAVAFWGDARREGLLTISCYCGGFLFLSLYARPRPWMLWTFAAALSLNCVLALIQLTGANPLGLYPAGMTYFDGNKLYSGQFLGTIGNVDLLSALLSAAIPLFWIAMWKWQDRRRFWLTIPLALSLAVLLLTFVEAGVLSAAATVLLSVPVLTPRGRSRRLLLLLLPAVLALLAAAVYWLGPRTDGFLYEASQLLRGRVEDDFGSGRIYIWRKAMELIRERPLLGGGPDTMFLRTDGIFQRYDPALDRTITATIDAAHNEYLNIWVHQGLPALLAYLAALLLAAVRWFRRGPENPRIAMLGGAVLGYCIQAFFGISSLITAPYFWLLLALHQREGAADTPENPQFWRRSHKGTEKTRRLP